MVSKGIVTNFPALDFNLSRTARRGKSAVKKIFIVSVWSICDHTLILLRKFRDSISLVSVGKVLPYIYSEPIIALHRLATKITKGQ